MLDSIQGEKKKSGQRNECVWVLMGVYSIFFLCFKNNTDMAILRNSDAVEILLATFKPQINS